MSRLRLLVVIAVTTSMNASQAQDRAAKKTKASKVAFLVKGAHCDRCVTVLRKATGKVKGIKFNVDRIQPGEKPKFFSEPFVIEIADMKKTHIGAIAKAVSEANTPHKDDLPPSLNLVLYTPDQIDEEAVMRLRSKLMDVNGVEVLLPGGLGGFPNKGFYWIRLEGAGGAELKDILAAVEKARVNVSLQKRKD